MLSPKVTLSIRVPKSGNSVEECEDHYAAHPEGWHFAVADGASDAIYSSIWANILVEQFVEYEVRDVPTEEFERWVAACRARWGDWESVLSAKALPWFTRDKLYVGSAAAFLGVVFQPLVEGHLELHAVAYGDSCIFIVQNDILRLTFPVDGR